MGLSAVAGEGRVARLDDPSVRLALLPGWLLVGALTLLALLGVSIPTTAQYLLLAAGTLAIGLPHGAVDYLVPFRAGDGSLGRSLGAVGLLYLVLGGAYALCWFLAPVPAAVGFVLLTWYHWGQGDLHPLVALAGADHLRSRPLRAATVVVRGGLPMLVPLLAFPAVYRSVLASFVAPFVPGAGGLAWVTDPGLRLALGGGFALLTVGTLAAGRLAATRDDVDVGGWRIDACETGLLWAFFLVVPPVLAVGAYFCGWHSLRHVVRYALLGDDDRDRRAVPSARRFARDALPTTIGALALLGAFALLVPAPPTTVAGWVALSLVFVAVLTLPHVAVVSWLDHRQGLWTPA
jgi:Brp/Blh family beta-carotene 15,15'-monooxygenase